MSSNEQIADIESTYLIKPTQPKMVDENKLKLYVGELIKTVGDINNNPEQKQIVKVIAKLRSKYKVMASKAQIRYIYEKFYNNIPINKNLGRFMIKKAMRSRSGVLVCTIVLKPDVFSCPKKCSYCPTETDLDGRPTQPKSYLSTEPAMLRALEYNFDIRGQIWDRLRAYMSQGNIREDSGSSKLEIIVSGGTWESYPYEYRNKVMTEVYWAANTFGEGNDRPILSVEEEISLNEKNKYLVIGLTLETRPDFITKQTIKDYRRWGVTRMQIGVQHYNDDILDGINRECHTSDTIKAISMLKQAGFKVVCHLMPDLPGSSPELDKWMFDQAINNPDLQFDDVKIYPTAVCQSSDPNIVVTSDIAEWYKNGTYTPYAENNLRSLIDVLKYYKTRCSPWVRIERLVRDIPKQSIEVGYEGISNLRQLIHNELHNEGLKCNCIRCMEIGDDDHLMDTASVVVHPYWASNGQEYHIAVESHEKSSVFDTGFWTRMWFLFSYYLQMFFLGRKTWWSGNMKTYNGLIGFCRFRIDSNPGGGFIKELENCALIREVHVYGHSLGVGSGLGSAGSAGSSQHKGFGQTLVKTAEHIAAQNGYSKIAVIAGVGTREYYKNKCGYHLEGTYMVKDIENLKNKYQEMKTNVPLFWLWLIGHIVIVFIMIIINQTFF